MFNSIANVLGYLLNFIYNIVNNYGLAIILFTLLIKIVLLPISIKLQILTRLLIPGILLNSIMTMILKI